MTALAKVSPAFCTGSGRVKGYIDASSGLLAFILLSFQNFTCFLRFWRSGWGLLLLLSGAFPPMVNWTRGQGIRS